MPLSLSLPLTPSFLKPPIVHCDKDSIKKLPFQHSASRPFYVGNLTLINSLDSKLSLRQSWVFEKDRGSSFMGFESSLEWARFRSLEFKF